MKWLFPLEDMKKLGPTAIDNSFEDIDIKTEVEIPIFPHCGSFSALRKYDRHRGIDLYAPEGTVVSTVEDGIVKMIRPWTGEKANCNWWEDTDAILIEGISGLIVYGEIEINKNIKVGDSLTRGTIIGKVKTVLKKDKGRPMSMLHLEVRDIGFYTNIDKNWTDVPNGISDPAPYLLNAINL